jgi:IS1 family transposase
VTFDLVTSTSNGVLIVKVVAATVSVTCVGGVVDAETSPNPNVAVPVPVPPSVTPLGSVANVKLIEGSVLICPPAPLPKLCSRALYGAVLLVIIVLVCAVPKRLIAIETEPVQWHIDSSLDRHRTTSVREGKDRIRVERLMMSPGRALKPVHVINTASGMQHQLIAFKSDKRFRFIHLACIGRDLDSSYPFSAGENGCAKFRRSWQAAHTKVLLFAEEFTRLAVKHGRADIDIERGRVPDITNAKDVIYADAIRVKGYRAFESIISSKPRTLTQGEVFLSNRIGFGRSLDTLSRLIRLVSGDSSVNSGGYEGAPRCPADRVLYSILAIILSLRVSYGLIVKGHDRLYGLNSGWWVPICVLCGTYGFGMMFYCVLERLDSHAETPQSQSQSKECHSRQIVPRKYLTGNSYWGTLIDMANVLNTDKQIAVIGALAEGSSIRSIERITGVHRDTIMRLGVKVGEGCAKMLDLSMRNLPCNRLEMDEIWGFVGKKDRNVREGDNAVGSVWTFCAIDAETKLVPAFKCGDRDAATAKAFVQDVANRMAYRVQISTDGLNAYVAAMESAFGGNVDYAQIIKTYGHEEVSNNRRYSAPEFVSSEKKIVVGNPDERLISTSYVERLNATTRLHMRRLTRLTLAFSKKRENFEAAVALHFAYYNFVKRHNTLRCTPAMAAGVTGSFWSVGDLLEAIA